MDHDFLFYASAVAACVSLVGAYLNAKKNLYSFIIWSVANIFWVIYDLSVGAYFQAALFVCYLSMNIYGFYCWKVKDTK
jgi:nicotinamide riboside transporter PnuC